MKRFHRGIRGRAARSGPASSFLVGLAIFQILLCQPSLAGHQDDVGLTRLKVELGTAMPSGSGVPVTQVEALSNGCYMPDPADGQFTSAPAKTLINKTNTSICISSHATGVGRLFYGNLSSLSPGVTAIDVYEALDWVGIGFLEVGVTYAGKPIQPFYGWPTVKASPSRVVNHSWVAGTSGSDALRRLDFVVEADELIQVAALNNGSTNRPIWADAFNAVTVGRSDGVHPRGTSALDADYPAGRTKPDLVAPLTVTSSTTPVLASAAALLVEVGRDPSLSTEPVQPSTTNRDGVTIRNAERTEAVKAALMAGADRVTANPTAANLTDYRADPANRSANGLDRRFGAGQINVFHGYHILAAGEQNSAEDDPGGQGVIGWTGFDVDPAFGGSGGTNATASYFFTADDSRRMLAASLVWNLDIHGGTWNNFNGAATLYNLDLSLHDVTDPLHPRLVAGSAGAADNTENLCVPLAPGRSYRLQVSPGHGQGPFQFDFALAWRMSVPPSSDGDALPDDWEVYFGLDHLDAGEGLGDSGLDTDRDGMPDEWEIFYGFSHLDPLNADEDPDEDGMDNGEEFLLGTDPTRAEIHLNLFGSSAQHGFWTDAAGDFLRARGCADVRQDAHDERHSITRGACGGVDVYVRTSSRASYDGIQAVSGASNPDGCPSPFQRRLVAAGSCVDWAPGGTPCAALQCLEVTVGTSDVAGSSLTQESHGNRLGPSGGEWLDRILTGADTGGLTVHEPLVVPFGFFANSSVRRTACLGPHPLDPTPEVPKAVSSWGNTCYDPDGDGHSADCVGYYPCLGGACAGGAVSGAPCTQAGQCPDVTLEKTRCERVPVDTISRLMAVAVFSGQARMWTDFGAWYTTDPFVMCLLHAGSGAHAALDHAVMRSTSNDWGWPLVTTQSAADPAVWFNEGTFDAMRCISQLPGAVGIAAADQLEGNENFPNVHALKFNGEEPRRTTLRNGAYDLHTSVRLYTRSLEQPLLGWVEDLSTFVSNPANLPASRAMFWATVSEMRFHRGTDGIYPGYVGVDTPQSP